MAISRLAGMMADVSIEKRYALLATVFALQNRDLGLLTENLVTLGFLPDTTDLDIVVPALENAFRDASGGGEV
jgi:predicted unusual protein kinase regulating ubiquinone biosynthesis (AarF/ABC1/UbiB family)